MSPVKFCPEHGPYDASFNACPECGGKPTRPQTLDDLDGLATEIGTRSTLVDDDQTVIPGRTFASGDITSETVIFSENRRFYDETQLPDRSALVEAIFIQ